MKAGARPDCDRNRILSWTHSGGALRFGCRAYFRRQRRPDFKGREEQMNRTLLWRILAAAGLAGIALCAGAAGEPPQPPTNAN